MNHPDRGAVLHDIFLAVESILSEESDPCILDLLPDHQTSLPLVRAATARKRVVGVMKFSGDAADVLEVEAILLDTDAAAVHPAQVSEWLHDDHALAAPCRRQTGSDSAGRAAKDTDVCFVNLSRTCCLKTAD